MTPKKILTFKKNKLFFSLKYLFGVVRTKCISFFKKNLHIWTYFTIPALTHIK